MNDFMIYINGVLVGPGFFSVAIQNTSAGRLAVITAPEDFFKGEIVNFADVIEVRVGKFTRRFRYERVEEEDDNFVKLEVNADDVLPARRRFKLDKVPSSF